MSWVDDMKRDAVRVADPKFKLQDGDVIDLNMEWDPGAPWCTL
jgi:hypothetical protein